VEGRPARWGAGGQARRPRRLGGNGEEARVCTTSDRVRYTGGPGNLGKWPAGGERKRGGELTAAVAMAGGAAEWRVEGKKGRLL
jgi:hypothetical protein